MKLLIFEGISGSGKSTLFHPVHKLSNYADLHIHRFTPTNWVYDRLSGRREVDYEEINTELQKLFDVYVIWCDCDPQIAYNRQIEKKDPMIEDLTQAKELFTEYFNKVTSFKHVIHLPTHALVIDECVDIISREIYR